MDTILKVKVAKDPSDDGSDRESTCFFELEDDELRSVFSRFGEIVCVET